MEEQKNNKEIGQKVREKRKKLKKSREELAEMINLSPNFLGQIERGEKSFSLETLYKLSYSLDMTMYSLLSRTTKDTEKEKQELIDIIERCSKKQIQFLLEIARSVKTYVDEK